MAWYFGVDVSVLGFLVCRPRTFGRKCLAKVSIVFKKGAFCEGICEVIRQVGEKLKSDFPVEDGDVNELPDEISYG